MYVVLGIAGVRTYQADGSSETRKGLIIVIE